VKEHLSSQEITEVIAGQGSRQAQEHVAQCQACGGEVQRTTEPLKMFAGALRSLGEEMGPSRPFVPDERRVVPVTGAWRWRPGRLTLAAAALLMMIAAPVYRHEELKREAALTAAQDELLLRQVESGISRWVPAPMEPLAKLMSNDVSR